MLIHHTWNLHSDNDVYFVLSVWRVHLVSAGVFVSLSAVQIPEKLLTSLTEESDHRDQITRTCSVRGNISLGSCCTLCKSRLWVMCWYLHA